MQVALPFADIPLEAPDATVYASLESTQRRSEALTMATCWKAVVRLWAAFTAATLAAMSSSVRSTRCRIQGSAVRAHSASFTFLKY